jgi:putative ABC transport system ATP-binding protein
MLNLNNVSLSFSKTNTFVLNQINYTVNHQDFVILLGSNGSGKSSLLKLLYREYYAASGHIYFLNKHIAHHSNKDFSREVSVLTQHTSDSLFNSLTVFENYLVIKKKRGELASRPRFVFNRASDKKFLMHYLFDFNPNLASKLNVPVIQLSGGERQALALSFSLLNQPKLLLLDEHTSALDPKTSDQIMQLTQKKILEHEITCILTTHDLDIALRYGNRILVLKEGKVQKTIDYKDKTFLSKDELINYYYE